MAKNHIENGPVKLTEANKLYLYQLLGNEIGTGRQTFLPKAEEALARVEITPERLGYADALSLFRDLSDVCDLIAFKGGRFYVTVRTNEAWDAALAAAGTKAPADRGGRSRRRKKAPLKPVRPRLYDLPSEEDEAAAEQVAEETTVEGRPEAETADAKAGALGDAGSADASDAPSPAAGQAEPAAQEAAATQSEPAAQAKPDAPAAQGGQDAAAGTSEPTHRRVPSILEQIAEQSAYLAGTDVPAPTHASAPEPSTSAPAQGEPARSGHATVEAPAAQPVASAPSPAVADTPREAPLAEAEAPQPAPAPALAAPEPEARPARHDDLPRSFADEVSVKPALLGLLTRILPFDADLMTVLDEDLRVARATGTATGSRSRVSFPLRYLQEDGSAPVSVTIRKVAKPGDARRWQLALVDGDDGTGAAHEAAGIEGLPQARGGYWAELAPRTSAADASADPVRELATFMEIGSWETFLGTVATAAAPERWNYPGEGVGKASRYGILREYLAATLARVRAQGRLAVAADGSFAAFDTGLVSPMTERLFAILEPTGTDIPWRFAGLAEAGSGELGARMAALLPELPEPASYLEAIDDVRPRPGALVIPDYRALLSDGLARFPRGFLSAQLEGTDAAAALDALDAATTPGARRDALRDLARSISGEPGRHRRICRAIDDAIDLGMRHARLSYRHVAPAYDAARDRMLLLLPLALVEDGTADCALALELMPSGAYTAASVVTLPRAYAAARVVSREAPSWLAPSRWDK